MLYPDRDFDPNNSLPQNTDDLIKDLELNTLFNAMAQEDEFIFDVVKRVVLTSLYDLREILYRQEILKDCLENAEIVRKIYEIPIKAQESKRKQWLSIFSLKYPSSILSSARNTLELYVDLLKELRHIADLNVDNFKSEGFRRFFAMISEELNDEYLSTVNNHLKALKFSDGVLVSAQLGKGNEGINYTLSKFKLKNQKLFDRLFSGRSQSYSFKIHPKDDRGAMILGELRDRSLNSVANAVAQAAEHVESFFNFLRWELAFYIGCLKLAEKLYQLNEPITFPKPAPVDERRLSIHGLYDVTLALTMGQTVVTNDVRGDGKDMVIITGANQGGKTTFLRSIGLAQLMMQCGMFVSAKFFSTNVCRGIFTHFKREEDFSIKSGKFDEEMGRMSSIIDTISPNSMILFNESFASTNEKEGSEIAWQVVLALMERRIKIFFVTHLYEFAIRFLNYKDVLFLRAERKPDGKRTFKIIEKKPLSTSYGQDLYYKIFKKKH